MGFSWVSRDRYKSAPGPTTPWLLPCHNDHRASTDMARKREERIGGHRNDVAIAGGIQKHERVRLE